MKFNLWIKLFIISSTDNINFKKSSNHLQLIYGIKDLVNVSVYTKE